MYEINIDGRWVEIEKSVALDKLGNDFAMFSDIETVFFTLPLIELGESRFCMFPLEDGDALFARQSSLIKHTYYPPSHFNYLLCPSDFLDSGISVELQRALGNKKSLLIGN